MKLIIPKYAQDFKCIGGACSDNCCIGWEIDIDGSTLEKYRRVSGELGKRLKKGIETDGDGTSHFALTGERCPFLNGENLCDIITGLGKGYLCEICREHPRFYITLGDTVFGGVGMCCEAAARLIIGETGAHEYAEIENYNAEPEECDSKFLELVLQYKQTIIYILQDKSLDFADKIAKISDEAIKLQEEIDGFSEALEPQKNTHHSPRELFDFYRSLEYMGDGLSPRLATSKEVLSSDIELPSETERYLTNIFIYFIDRYLLRAVEDGDILAKIMIASVSTLAIALMLLGEKNSDLEKAVEIAKLYSKEIEYNEDNIARIEDMTRKGLWELSASLWRMLVKTN